MSSSDSLEPGRSRPGFVVWFTGLSAAGKTTISVGVTAELERFGFLVETLDGDVVRERLSKGLGFSKDDRDANVERIGWVASRLARAGVAVVVAAISPYEDARKKARSLVEQYSPFVCVYVATSLEECCRRDTKGLYRRAFAGEIQHFTGVDDPYEPPLDPELRVDTQDVAPEESVARVLEELRERGLLTGSRLDTLERSGVER